MLNIIIINDHLGNISTATTIVYGKWEVLDHVRTARNRRGNVLFCNLEIFLPLDATIWLYQRRSAP
jgi:hypothetical protein